MDFTTLKPGEYISGINANNFEEHALQLFRFQHTHSAIYRAYCDALRIAPNDVSALTEIPFLPVSFFKTHRVQTGDWNDAALHFESSGTTGESVSRHYVRNAALCEEALLAGFSAAFGTVAGWTILALLPSYLERQTSSLVHMAKTMMAHSMQPDNAFYLDDWQSLAKVLGRRADSCEKTLLLGVTFALLDFAAAHPMDLSGITVMETGGMKGRREEWTRDRVHQTLQAAWNIPTVATEYGMTELLSQGYAHSEGLLTPAPAMRVLVREITDPLSTHASGAGVLNIIDLANIHSCAFIATEDIGIVHDAATFEVTGRLDHATLRGCSLLTAS